MGLISKKINQIDIVQKHSKQLNKIVKKYKDMFKQNPFAHLNPIDSYERYTGFTNEVFNFLVNSGVNSSTIDITYDELSNKIIIGYDFYFNHYTLRIKGDNRNEISNIILEVK